MESMQWLKALCNIVTTAGPPAGLFESPVVAGKFTNISVVAATSTSNAYMNTSVPTITTTTTGANNAVGDDEHIVMTNCDNNKIKPTSVSTMPTNNNINNNTSTTTTTASSISNDAMVLLEADEDDTATTGVDSVVPDTNNNSIGHDDDNTRQGNDNNDNDEDKERKEKWKTTKKKLATVQTQNDHGREKSLVTMKLLTAQTTQPALGDDDDETKLIEDTAVAAGALNDESIQHDSAACQDKIKIDKHRKVKTSGKVDEDDGVNSSSTSGVSSLASTPLVGQLGDEQPLDERQRIHRLIQECLRVRCGHANNNNNNNNSIDFPAVGQSFKSSKTIEVVLEVIKSRQLATRFDPFVVNKPVTFQVNPLVCLEIDSCTIRGFSNVSKGQNDGLVRCLGPSLYSLDCIVCMSDLVCEARCRVKFGGRWHLRRVCLRNKTLTLTMDRCLIYVELLIDNQARTIKFKRFSPISHQQVRCKTRALSLMSLNTLFSRLLQRYFRRYYVLKVLQLENDTRNRLDRQELLDYDDIVTNTALIELFKCIQPNTDTTENLQGGGGGGGEANGGD